MTMLDDHDLYYQMLKSPPQARGQRDLYKSRESLYSTMLPLKEEGAGASEDCRACSQCDTCCDSCCCSFWSYVLVILFLIGGFSGDIIVCDKERLTF